MTKDQVISIDIGNASIKILYIEKVAGVLRLIDGGVTPNPDPDDPQQVAGAVKQLWNQLGIKYNLFNKHRIEIGISLPRGFVVTKRLSNLPPTTQEEQLPSMVGMAAETELPFPVQDAIYTYHDIQRSPDALSVELVSTRRETVERYIDILKEVGISPTAVIPSMYAISSVAQSSLSSNAERTIIVDIGAGNTEFCLMYGNTLQFSRRISVNGDQLTELFESELELDAEAAELEKRQVSAGQPPTRTWSRRFIAELVRSIAAAEREVNGGGPMEISEIRLCGGGAEVPELAQTCQQQLQIPTRVWNPLLAGTLDTTSPSLSSIESYSNSLAIPLGVGIHLLETEVPVSLIPKEVGEKRAEFGRKRQQVLAATVGGIVILFIVFGSLTWSRTQSSKVDELDRRIANLTQEQVQANKQLALDLIVADKLTHQISPIDILHTLSTLFNDRTKVAWKTFDVKNLDDLTKTRITFNIQANSNESINAMDSSLRNSKLFSKIETGETTTTGDQRRPTFEVKISCQIDNASIQKFAQKRHPKPVIEFIIAEPENEAANLDEVNIPPPRNIEFSNEDNEEDR